MNGLAVGEGDNPQISRSSAIRFLHYTPESKAPVSLLFAPDWMGEDLGTPRTLDI